MISRAEGTGMARDMIPSSTTALRQQLSEQRRRRGRPWLFTVGVVGLAIGIGISSLAALRYGAHLLWLCEASRQGLRDIQAIPNRPMPEKLTPNGWVPCRVGCIEFRLPPELANNSVSEKKGCPFVTFTHGSRTLAVALPTDVSEFSGLLETASKLSPQQQQFTMPRLRRACYQTRSADFRWSMTGDEVRWHAFCITTSKLLRPMLNGHTESFFHQDLDGIAHFGPDHVFFEWQSNHRPRAGYMHFQHGDGIDRDWIRAVCQSLKLSSEGQRRGS